MGNIDKIEDVLGKLYDRFIMRDLAHVFAGAFALVALSYSFGKYRELFHYVSSRPLNFGIVLFVSYFFGILAGEIPAWIRYRRWARVIPDDHNTDFPGIVKKIEEKYGTEPLRLIERFEYFRRFGSSLCVTAVIGLLFVPLKWLWGFFEYFDIYVILGIIFILISSLRLFARMKERIKDAKEHYLKEFGSKS